MLERKRLLTFAVLLTLVALTSVSIAVAGGRPLVADLLDSNEVPRLAPAPAERPSSP